MFLLKKIQPSEYKFLFFSIIAQMEILFMNGLNGITISRNIFRRLDGVKFTDGDGELGRGGD